MMTFYDDFCLLHRKYDQISEQVLQTACWDDLITFKSKIEIIKRKSGMSLTVTLSLYRMF